MVGWLKFEANTPEKPEVFAITAALGWDDPDLTVGKLLKIWRWFDQHTVDGNAPCVTTALLDRICGVSGFAQAMVTVGWLVADAAGSHLPHFQRHNGKTAKDRALTAERVANFKSRGERGRESNAEGNGATRAATQAATHAATQIGNNAGAGANASANFAGGKIGSIWSSETANALTVSPALPREEKKREEKKSAAKAEGSATRLPQDWQPGEREIAFCKAERPDLEPLAVAVRFADYWVAQPGAKGRKLDWLATWRNWVRNERGERGERSAAGSPACQDKFQLAGLDRAGDHAAQAESMRRHGIDSGKGGEL